MTNIVHATSDNRRDQLVRESQVGVWECPRRPAERFNSKDARRRSPTRQFHTSVTPKTDKIEIGSERRPHLFRRYYLRFRKQVNCGYQFNDVIGRRISLSLSEWDIYTGFNFIYL